MTVVVKNYREFLRACDLAGKETRKAMRAELRLAGGLVRDDAQVKFSRYGTAGAGQLNFGGSRASHADSAAGYRVRVRQRGVEVEQSLRKTTGKHPEYGSAQMRHGLIPAAKAKEPEFVAGVEAAISVICDRFERRD